MSDHQPVHWIHVLLVFVGGVFGTALRYAIELQWPATFDEFPWTTFAINVSGAFVLGVLLAIVARRPSEGSTRYRLLLGTGFCGGFTTYSALALESVRLFETGLVLPAAYPLTSLGVGVIAAGVGLTIGERLLRP